jgi:hypothetical protein
MTRALHGSIGGSAARQPIARGDGKNAVVDNNAPVAINREQLSANDDSGAVSAGGRDLSSGIFESTFEIDRTEFGLNGIPKWGGLKVSISKRVQIHLAIATTMNASPPAQ